MADVKNYTLEEQFNTLGLELSQMTSEIIKRAQESMGMLQQQVYGLIVEKVKEKTKSTSDIYLKNLGMSNDQDNVWVVYLKKEAAWIEDGIEEGEMIDRILNGGKPAKNGKNGRYKTIPFQLNKKPSQASRAQMQIQDAVKRELKSRGLDKPIKVDGKTVQGRAATVNIDNFATSRISRKPILSGVTIYQKSTFNKQRKERVSRDIFTFRTISESQKGSGKWVHPGSKGVKIFEEIAPKVDEMYAKIVKDIVEQVRIEGAR
jgi:hypothetical protein